MDVTAIMTGSGFDGPVKDKKMATAISKAAAAIDKYYKEDFKNTTGQSLRKECSTLHTYAIEWDTHGKSLPWGKDVETLLLKATDELQTLRSTGITLEKIRTSMYGR